MICESKHSTYSGKRGGIHVNMTMPFFRLTLAHSSPIPFTMQPKLLKIAFLSFLVLSLFSCKKDKDDEIPANEITDAQGINIKLNWSLTDGSSALAGADIDFYVYKGVGTAKEFIPVVEADNSTAFEDENFLNALADGDYTLEIDYFEILKNGKFNLVFKAMGSDRAYSLNDNSFTTANHEQFFDFAKISKTGTKYTFTKL